MRVIKLHSVHSIQSYWKFKWMLAAYMRHMRNNNLEIRITGNKRSLQQIKWIHGGVKLNLIATLCLSKPRNCGGLHTVKQSVGLLYWWEDGKMKKQESTIWYKKALKNSTSNKIWIAISEWYSLIWSSYVIT